MGRGSASLALEFQRGRVALAAVFSLIVAAILLLGAPGAAFAANGAWRTGTNGWWYEYDQGGYASSGWDSIDGSWYLFDDDGWMRTGWQKVDGTWYYLGSDGAMRTGWTKVSGTWYYLRGSGAMATGWASVGGDWYYMDGSGAMQTGWQHVGGSWYYLNSGGDMAEGWKSLGGTWYYLTPGSGAMATGWASVGGTWYYMDGSGAMKTGWQHIGGDWYHLQSSGAMSASTWVGNYYVNGSGRMVTNQWVGQYWVGADGAWVPNASGNSGNTGSTPTPEPEQPATYRVTFRAPDPYYLKPTQLGNGIYQYPSEILSTQYVQAGSNAAAPTVELDEGYYLKGWDKSFSNVRGDLTVTAVIGDKYDDWRAKWLKDNITASMSTYDKVNNIVKMIAAYPYSGKSSSGRGLYFEGSGDCYAGNLMLRDFCDDLGIRCVFQNAMTMQRWYNINFGGVGNHHNDVVWIDDKQYLADATPGFTGAIEAYTPQTWDPQAYALIHGTSSASQGAKNREPSFANSYYTGCAYVTCGLTKNQFTVSSSSASGLYFEAFCSEIVSITSSNQAVMLNGDASGNYIANEEYDEGLDTPPYGRAGLAFEGKGTTTLTVKLRGVYGVDKGKVSTFTYTVTYQ